LHARLAAVGVAPVGPPVALYYDSGDSDSPIDVVAALPIGSADVSDASVEVLELPDEPRAVATIHRGHMNRVERGYEALLRWAEQTGERVDGYSREVYLDIDGAPETWVTELQFVLAPRG
jgi:effector-binding domain-containing protein